MDLLVKLFIRITVRVISSVFAIAIIVIIRGKNRGQNRISEILALVFAGLVNYDVLLERNSVANGRA